jgi:hypothetical protein
MEGFQLSKLMKGEVAAALFAPIDVFDARSHRIS